MAEEKSVTVLLEKIEYDLKQLEKHERANAIRHVVTGLVFVVMLAIVMYPDFKRFRYLDNIPCDHGDKCELRHMAKWFYKPQHSATQYCNLHKMYHHQHRSCMDDKTAVLDENKLIQAREKEIGYIRPPDTTLRRTDQPIRVDNPQKK